MQRFSFPACRTVIRITALLLTIGALCGCGMTPQQIQAQTLAYVAENDRPPFVRDALLRLQPVEGMNPRDIEYLYGQPVRVNRASYGTQRIYRQTCQYSRNLYQENIYVYFEGDTVVGWQVNDCIY